MTPMSLILNSAPLQTIKTTCNSRNILTKGCAFQIVHQKTPYSTKKEKYLKMKDRH
jgi:hypothetical protein